MSSMNGGLSRRQNVTGLIVYDIGNYPAKQKTGRNIYPGYVLMRKSEDILQVDCREGVVHGKLCKDFFKCDPSEMVA